MAGRRRRPSNASGAHYLSDPQVARQLVRAAGVGRGDLVLDIGAGGGFLTAALERGGARVIAVERDALLARRLRRRFERANVVVLEADALELPLPRRPYRVAANIPFDITTRMLGRMLDSPSSRLQGAALVIQWGAALGLTSRRPADVRVLWWSSRFDLKIVRRVPAASFSPAPAVKAAIMSIEPRASVIELRHRRAFLALIAHGLANRHAPIGRALAPVFSRRQLHRVLQALDVDSREFVSSLTVDDWETIGSTMLAVVHPSAWPRRVPSWWRRISS